MAGKFGKDSKRTMVRRTSLTALALALALSASALAGPQMAGRTYSANTPAWGINHRGHKIYLPVGLMTLKVSHSGKTVTVHFASVKAVLYCQTQDTLHSQTTTPAKISSDGSFTAVIDEKFRAAKGLPSIVQVVSGHFSGNSVHGTIRTEAAACSGYTNYTAQAH